MLSLPLYSGGGGGGGGGGGINSKSSTAQGVDEGGRSRTLTSNN